VTEGYAAVESPPCLVSGPIIVNSSLGGKVLPYIDAGSDLAAKVPQIDGEIRLELLNPVGELFEIRFVASRTSSQQMWIGVQTESEMTGLGFRTERRSSTNRGKTGSTERDKVAAIMLRFVFGEDTLSSSHQL